MSSFFWSGTTIRPTCPSAVGGIRSGQQDLVQQLLRYRAVPNTACSSRRVTMACTTSFMLILLFAFYMKTLYVPIHTAYTDFAGLDGLRPLAEIHQKSAPVVHVHRLPPRVSPARLTLTWPGRW